MNSLTGLTFVIVSNYLKNLAVVHARYFDQKIIAVITNIDLKNQPVINQVYCFVILSLIHPANQAFYLGHPDSKSQGFHTN